MENELKSCPFCGGKALSNPVKVLRNGYEGYKKDPDAYAYYITCIACASTGGWSKGESGAILLWNMRDMTFGKGIRHDSVANKRNI